MSSDSKQIGLKEMWPWVAVVLILIAGPYLLAWALAPWDERTPAAWRTNFLADWERVRFILVEREEGGSSDPPGPSTNLKHTHWEITHVYVGQYEREIMTGEVTPPGRIVYQSNGVTIYQVRPD